MTRQITTNPEECVIHIDLKTQSLVLKHADKSVFETGIASARKGAGEIEGSEQTPRGWHIVRAKIGKDLKENTVFKGRRVTGELYSDLLRNQFPERDWILTRIMWLSGLEPGFNRLGNVDTMQRFIYIHGCPDDDPMGERSSHGCIKMRNSDIVRLFDLVDVGTKVFITE